ncbi:MAG: hypothetical protein SOT25_03330 [Malacoplasma sp.]|nr:hypothetical protein [Malacoplasma sp.]
MYKFLVLSKSILFSLIGLNVLVVGLLTECLDMYLSGHENSYLCFLSSAITGDNNSFNLSKSIEWVILPLSCLISVTQSGNVLYIYI